MRPLHNLWLLILQDIIKNIRALELPLLNQPHEVASEIDEIKFGLYVLSAGTQMDLPLPYLRRAAFRVLQLLNNPDTEFEKKEALKQEVMRAHALLREEGMPIATDVQYAKPYDNLLFHLDKGSLLFKAFKEAGVSNYFINPALDYTQRILNRLSYYLNNFNFPSNWIEALENIRKCSTSEANLDPILNTIYFIGKELVRDENERLQFLALSFVVLGDSADDASKFNSCYYPDKSYRNLLASISAKLPADQVLRAFKTFSTSEERTEHEKGFCAMLLNFLGQHASLEKNTPLKKKSELSQELRAVAAGLFTQNTSTAKKTASAILSAIDQEGELAALNTFREIEKDPSPEDVCETLRNAFSLLREKYERLIQVEGKPYLLPRGLGSNFAIAPIILAGDAKEFEAIQAAFLSALRISGLPAGHNLPRAEAEEQCLGFYREGKSPLDEFLLLTFDPKKNEIHLELDLHFLSQQQIQGLVSLVITALSCLKTKSEKPALEAEELIKKIDRATSALEALHSEAYTMDPEIKSHTQDTLSNLHWSKQQIEQKAFFDSFNFTITQDALIILVGILEFHHFVDLSTLQIPREENPVPEKIVDITPVKSIETIAFLAEELPPQSLETPPGEPLRPRRNSVFEERLAQPRIDSPQTPSGEELRSSPENDLATRRDARLC